MSIKAIIWDLGGVLLRTEDADLYVTVAKKTNLPYEKIREVHFGEMNDKIDLGEITEEAFKAYAMDTIEISETKYAHLMKVMDEVSYIDKVLMEKIADLRKKYKIGLLSNWTGDLRKRIDEDWQIGGAFDEIVISHEVGLLKPDAAIYTLMLERLGVRAEEAVFVDDRIKNVDGAEKVGLFTVFYENRIQTLEELDRLLGANK